MTFASGPLLTQILALLSQAFLTALSLISVYTVYYIFMPSESPRLVLALLGLMGSISMLMQLSHSTSPLLPALIFCMLSTSLLATLYLFIQLFLKTETRSLKTLSLTFSVLTCISIVYALARLSASFQQVTFSEFNFTQWGIALAGAAFLISSVARPALRWAVAMFLFLIGWWFVLRFGGSTILPTGSAFDHSAEIWSCAIQAVALWGLFFGVRAVRQHGGLRTNTGKAISFFTLGLAIQIFAHNLYYIYVFLLGIETPYPGLPDIGYLGSSLLYLIGVLFLGKGMGLSYRFSELKGKLLGLATCIILFLLSYSALRNGFVLDWSEPVKVLLDIWYPLLGSLFISLMLVLWLSRKSKNTSAIPLAPLLWALTAQWLADAAYTYLLESGWWPDGAVSDLMYLSAYFLMSVALIKMVTAPKVSKLKMAESVMPDGTVTRNKSYVTHSTVAIFIVLTIWWIGAYLMFDGNVARIGISLWCDIYPVILAWGVWLGFRQSQKSGGPRNALGTGISFLTLGILFQSLGGIMYGFYVNWVGIAVPYPSPADVGWIGSIVFYAIGAFALGRAAGAKKLLKTWRVKLLLGSVAIGAFTFYWAALGSAGYVPDIHKPLLTSLDIVYSVTGPIYLAFAALAYYAVKKNKDALISSGQALWVLGALGMQYISDLNFIYNVSKETWVDGSYGDLLLLGAYFAMTMAISRLGKKDPVPYTVAPMPYSYPVFTDSDNPIYNNVIAIFLTIRSTTLKQQSVRPPLLLPQPQSATIVSLEK